MFLSDAPSPIDLTTDSDLGTYRLLKFTSELLKLR